MQTMARALVMMMLLVSGSAFGAGLDCTSTVAQGSKKVFIDLGAGTVLSRLAFGPCHGPPPTCRPIEFPNNLRAAIDRGNLPLGQYYGENGRQTLNVVLSSFSSASKVSGVAQVSLGTVGRPVNLDVTCVASP